MLESPASIKTFPSRLADALSKIQKAMERVPNVDVDADDFVTFVENFASEMEFYILKNYGGDVPGYGNSWKSSLGALACIPWIKKKMDRLLAMAWPTPGNPGLYWKTKSERLFTEARDMRLYLMFFNRLLQIHRGVDPRALDTYEKKDT